MFTNVLLGLSLGLALTSAAPDVSKFPVLGTNQAICPDGTLITITMYDVDSNDPQAAIVVYSRVTGPVGALDTKAKRIYVYSENKDYAFEDALEKYPTPCELPVKTGA